MWVAGALGTLRVPADSQPLSPTLSTSIMKNGIVPLASPFILLLLSVLTQYHLGIGGRQGEKKEKKKKHTA